MTLRSFWAAILFGVLFMVMVFYLMVNILIAIVEEAYFISRKNGRHLEALMWRNLENIVTTGAPGNKDAEEEEHVRQHKEAEEDEEWMHSIFTTLPPLKAVIGEDDLMISLAEEAAEVYILGTSHWEYSKVSYVIT
jgi:hypothetical protein